MKNYKLFLDDLRTVQMVYPYSSNEEFTICRDYNEAVDQVLKNGIPCFISFDHDLGLDETGYDFTKWLCNYMLDNDIKGCFDYIIHSANPVGRENIDSYLKNFFKFNK